MGEIIDCTVTGSTGWKKLMNGIKFWGHTKFTGQQMLTNVPNGQSLACRLLVLYLYYSGDMDVEIRC